VQGGGSRRQGGHLRVVGIIGQFCDTAKKLDEGAGSESEDGQNKKILEKGVMGRLLMGGIGEQSLPSRTGLLVQKQPRRGEFAGKYFKGQTIYW